MHAAAVADGGAEGATLTQTVLDEFAGLHHVLAERHGAFRPFFFAFWVFLCRRCVSATFAAAHQRTVSVSDPMCYKKACRRASGPDVARARARHTRRLLP